MISMKIILRYHDSFGEALAEAREHLSELYYLLMGWVLSSPTGSMNVSIFSDWYIFQLSFLSVSKSVRILLKCI